MKASEGTARDYYRTAAGRRIARKQYAQAYDLARHGFTHGYTTEAEIAEWRKTLRSVARSLLAQPHAPAPYGGSAAWVLGLARGTALRGE